MRRRLAYAPGAVRDLEGLRGWIARENPAAARRTVERIVAAAERLTEFPEPGRPGLLPGTRVWVVTGLPYLID